MVRHGKLDRIHMHLLDLQLVAGLPLGLRAAVGHHVPALGFAGHDLPVLRDPVSLLHRFFRFQLWHDVSFFLYSVFAGGALGLTGTVDEAGTTSFFFTGAILDK
jgi:hypothetical protein